MIRQSYEGTLNCSLNAISQHSEMIILGDFNLDLFTNASEHLKELCSNLNILQLITDPTRPNPKNHNRSTLIDLILTNRSNKLLPVVFLPLV